MARFLICTSATLALLGAVMVASPHRAAASSSAASGERVFQMHCAICHSTSRSGGTAIGPHLFGIVGRKAGSLPGFAYSPAMKKAGIVWSKDNLARYITSPRTVVPGNRMPFGGLHNQADVSALVDYLATLK